MHRWPTRWPVACPTALRPPGFIEPCLPTHAGVAPSGSLWIHEIKHDGFRFICRRDGDRVRLFTRNGHDWTVLLPRVAAALRSLPVGSVAIAVHVLRDHAAVLGPAQQARQGRPAALPCVAAEIPAIELDQAEGIQERRCGPPDLHARGNILVASRAITLDAFP